MMKIGRGSPTVALALLSMVSGAAVMAQVSGYPIDPATSQQSTNRTTVNQSATTASQAQTGVPQNVSTESYQPDEIIDRSQNQNNSSNLDNSDLRNAPNRNNFTYEDNMRRARPPAQPSEFEKYVSKIVDKPLRRFGANLLVPDARDFTTPPTTTVPSDYRLNPGDEILLGLTGSVEASNLRLTVDSDGRIFVPKVGAISVAGVPYGDLQQFIARQVARQYRNFRVAVSVGRLHGITVYVTGFANQPGSYTVSSLSTLVNAVLAAGGPSGGGSFRSIQVRRNGRLISDFDLYNLLLKGDKSADVVLQNGDVIYIAPAGAQVAVIGSVNVEAIYEARANETTYDMLLYAGGVNTVADDTRLLLIDPTKTGGWQELKPSQIQTRVASRGEIVRVLTAVGIAQPLLTQPALVTLSGEVYRPGRYYVRPGTPLSAVIQQAGGLTPQAFAYGTVFTRESVRATQKDSYDRALRDVELLLTTQPLTSVSQTEQFSPARLEAVRSVVDQMKRREPDGRMVLQVTPSDRVLPQNLIVENNDTLYIPSQPISVGVFGAVPSPASFQYERGRTVGDYLREAGGVQKMGDRSQIFVVRANGTLLSRRAALKAPALPGDLIFVPINATRGEFWVKLQAISSSLFPGIIAGAAVLK